jgi:hypothetical protein
MGTIHSVGCGLRGGVLPAFYGQTFSTPPHAVAFLFNGSNPPAFDSRDGFSVRVAVLRTGVPAGQANPPT